MRSCWFCAVLACTAPEVAFGQATDAPLAEMLFQEGLKLMAERRFEQACPKLEESQRIEPGIGTLLHLADCYEQAGRLASAWATFQEAIPPARKAGHREREDAALKRVAALEPRLPRLLLLAPAAAPTGMVVEREGVVMTAQSLGAPIPVNPGRIVLVVRAEGHVEQRVEVTAEEGKTVTLTLPALVPHEAEPAAAPGRRPPPPTGLSGVQIGGIALGAAGLVSLGVGVGFGVKTIEDWSAAEDECVEANAGWQCTQAGVDAAAAADTAGWVSTAGFIAGGALATGSVLMLVLGAKGSPSGKEAWVLPLFTSGLAGVVGGGSFQ